MKKKRNLIIVTALVRYGDPQHLSLTRSLIPSGSLKQTLADLQSATITTDRGNSSFDVRFETTALPSVNSLDYEADK